MSEMHEEEMGEKQKSENLFYGLIQSGLTGLLLTLILYAFLDQTVYSGSELPETIEKALFLFYLLTFSVILVYFKPASRGVIYNTSTYAKTAGITAMIMIIVAAVFFNFIDFSKKQGENDCCIQLANATPPFLVML